MTKVKALNTNIILDQHPEKSGSDILDVSDLRTFRYGTILSVGSQVKNYKEGDVVMYAKDATYEINLDDETYYRLDNEEDIYVKIVE